VITPTARPPGGTLEASTRVRVRCRSWEGEPCATRSCGSCSRRFWPPRFSPTRFVEMVMVRGAERAKGAVCVSNTVFQPGEMIVWRACGQDAVTGARVDEAELQSREPALVGTKDRRRAPSYGCGARRAGPAGCAEREVDLGRRSGRDRHVPGGCAPKERGPSATAPPGPVVEPSAHGTSSGVEASGRGCATPLRACLRGRPQGPAHPGAYMSNE